MSKQAGRKCDFCGEFLGDDLPFTVNLMFGAVAARFEPDRGPPDACGACVSKMFEAVVVAVEPRPAENGEIKAIRLAKYARR